MGMSKPTRPRRPKKAGRPANRAMQYAARFMAMTQGYTDNHARALLRDECKSHLSPADWYVVARGLELEETQTLEDFTAVLQELGVGRGWSPS